jgi:hypothetical protein
MIFDRLSRHFEYSCLRVACVIESITVSNVGLLYLSSKPSSKYSTDVRYYLQVETNARSALIGLYCRAVGQIRSTVVSLLKIRRLHAQAFAMAEK